MNNAFFSKICEMFQMGTLLLPVRRVEGGYLHQMYQLQTSCGVYALKLLNPLIMQRPEALQNFRQAEMLERKLQAAGLPVVPALIFNNQKMQCLEGQYFYLFDWIEGKAMPADKITVEHCRKIGQLLGKIHALEKHDGLPCIAPLRIDWKEYALQAKKINHPLSGLLEKNQHFLYSLQEKRNSAVLSLPDIGCICHGDMDVKNVLWQNDEPYVIDLECLAISNPYIEMLTLALSWSGYEQGNLDKERFKAFIKACQKENHLPHTDWQMVYDANMGVLEWLAYNIRRALMIEAGSQEESQMGLKQVFQTMNQIHYYNQVKKEVLDLLDECAFNT